MSVLTCEICGRRLGSLPEWFAAIPSLGCPSTVCGGNSDNPSTRIECYLIGLTFLQTENTRLKAELREVRK